VVINPSYSKQRAPSSSPEEEDISGDQVRHVPARRPEFSARRLQSGQLSLHLAERCLALCNKVRVILPDLKPFAALDDRQRPVLDPWIEPSQLRLSERER